MPLRLKLSLIATFLILGWGLHTYDKQKAVKQATGVLIAKYEKKLSEESEKARKTEHALQENADRLREDKDAKIKAVNGKLAVALGELRKRPERTKNNSQDTGNNQACTATSLFREDAEFLAREAARADSILLERDYYYNQYESVRRKLDEASD